jgi:polysaccharide pyruvyl transferase WcaK-like protein
MGRGVLALPELAREPSKTVRRWEGGKPYFLPVRVPLRGRAASRNLRVLLAGGFGYGNTGDEAQLAANIAHWRRLKPDAEIIVLSPDPEYTARTHAVRAESASRVVFFGVGRTNDYALSNGRFRRLFFRTRARTMFASRLLRSRGALWGVSSSEADFLALLASADVLHLTGGGYLTGRTLSRLWDHMLLIRLADVLRVPTILSGQTIGVLGNRQNRSIARWGLSKVRAIYLRDHDASSRALARLGIDDGRVRETFDDALFAPQADATHLRTCLRQSGVDPERPYAAVHLHGWGLDALTADRVARRFACLCGRLSRDYGLQVLLVPMIQRDEDLQRRCQALTGGEARMLAYDYDYLLAKATIGGARLCVTMKHHPIVFAIGNAVPTVAIALDPYYKHKNAGALRLCGFGGFAVGASEFFGRGLDSCVDEALRRAGDIAHALRDWLAGVEARDGEAVRQFLSSATCSVSAEASDER